jgi:hypothetical protein
MGIPCSNLYTVRVSEKRYKYPNNPQKPLGYLLTFISFSIKVLCENLLTFVKTFQPLP